MKKSTLFPSLIPFVKYDINFLYKYIIRGRGKIERVLSNGRIFEVCDYKEAFYCGKLTLSEYEGAAQSIRPGRGRPGVLCLAYSMATTPWTSDPPPHNPFALTPTFPPSRYTPHIFMALSPIVLYRTVNKLKRISPYRSCQHSSSFFMYLYFSEC